jgi:hypothetical protein
MRDDKKWYRDKKWIVSISVAVVGIVVSVIYANSSSRNSLTSVRENTGFITQGQTGNNIIIERSAVDKHGSSKKDFDDIDLWSVSFTIGSITSARGPRDAYLMIQGCDFSNLSTTQRRVLDFKLVLATKKDDHPDLVLNTAFLAFQPEQLSAKDLGRLNGTLSNPLVLEPGVFVEGMVEFGMSPQDFGKYHEMLDHHLLDMQENSVLYVIDRRSGLTKKTKLGEHYDASTDAAWRAGCPASLRVC